MAHDLQFQSICCVEDLLKSISFGHCQDISHGINVYFSEKFIVP